MSGTYYQCPTPLTGFDWVRSLVTHWLADQLLKARETPQPEPWQMMSWTGPSYTGQQEVLSISANGCIPNPAILLPARNVSLPALPASTESNLPTAESPAVESQKRSASTPRSSIESGKQKRSYADIAACARKIKQREGALDNKSGEKMVRYFRASLLPRKPRRHRGPSANVLRAAELLRGGKEWAEVYFLVIGPRWKYKQKERAQLNRNVNALFKKQMRKEGAPKGQDVRVWLSEQRRARGTV